MEIWRLRYFLVLAEELHFRRAAERLQISQPGLSQQIAKLENQLGVELFDRTNGVALTGAGEALQRSGGRLIREVEQVEAEIRALATGRTGILRLLLTRSAAGTSMSDMVEGFRQTHPSIKLDVETGWTAWNLRALRAGEADVAAILLPIEPHDDLNVVEVGTEPLSVALPNDHPLAAAEELTPDDLVDEPFLFWPRDQAPGSFDELMRSLWNPRGKEVFRYEPDIIRLIDAVQHGLGFTIATRARGRMMHFPGIRWKPLPDRVAAFRYGLCWPKVTVNPSSRVFGEYIKQWYQSRMIHDWRTAGESRRTFKTR